MSQGKAPLLFILSTTYTVIFIKFPTATQPTVARSAAMKVLGVAAFGRKFAISAARSQPFFLFQGRVSKYKVI